MRSLKDHEHREYVRLTVKSNISHDEAQMKIAEDRAILKMRDENAKARETADQAWRSAKILEKDAKRKLNIVERAGLVPPHPDSLAAREARKAEDDARMEAYRREHNIQPLGENDPIPDLIAAADIGWQNAGYDKG